MLEHRCDPIWYALAESPTLTGPQWRAVVHQANDRTDPNLLRLLFERPDRSDEDRTWLLDTGYPFLFDAVLASPVATAEHARQVLARRDEPTRYRSPLDESEAQAVATGVTRHPRIADDESLQQLAIEALDRLDQPAALMIAGRCGRRAVPEALLWALLGRAVHVSPASRGPWEKPTTEPVGGNWSRLWTVLRELPAAVQAEAARRYPRVQAVLLEYGTGLDETVLAACLPVLTDPHLGGPDPLSVAGRLATLRRWIERHPSLTEAFTPARVAAAVDAVRELERPEQWTLVDELVQFTTDSELLAAAVRQITGRLDRLRSLRQVDPDLGPDPEDRETTWRAARTALATLAGCPHTPDDVLVAVLPATPQYTSNDIAEARPHLADECTAELLSRTGVVREEKLKPLVEVADDAELAATGNPAGVLTGYLTLLPQASRGQASRLAVQLLRSRYADATVLAALPAEVVLQSPWQAPLAGQMIAEACGDDPQRWAALHESTRSGLTFGGFLAQLREYIPTRSGTGLAGYRHCHACQLIGPHAWAIFADQQPQAQMLAERRPGWMSCLLCQHQAPPAALLAADVSRSCPTCGARIDHPAGAAVLQCPGCQQLFFAPDLPADLRPRVDAVLAEQQRRATLVQQLSDRIAAFNDQSSATAARTSWPAPPGPDSVRASGTARSAPPQPTIPTPRPDWLTDEPTGEQFRTALITAIRHTENRARADAALLRYGLGRSRRPRTVAEIASRGGVTAATAQQRINGCLRDIHLAALRRRRATPTAGERASIIAIHLANEALGTLDIPRDDDLAPRIAGLIITALPGLDAGAGVRLLLRLTGRHRELSQVYTGLLIEMVGAETS